MIEPKEFLIVGASLTKLKNEHGVGLTTIGTYAIKRIDTDYLLEE